MKMPLNPHEIMRKVSLLHTRGKTIPIGVREGLTRSFWIRSPTFENPPWRQPHLSLLKRTGEGGAVAEFKYPYLLTDAKLYSIMGAGVSKIQRVIRGFTPKDKLLVFYPSAEHGPIFASSSEQLYGRSPGRFLPGSVSSLCYAEGSDNKYVIRWAQGSYAIGTPDEMSKSLHFEYEKSFDHLFDELFRRAKAEEKGVEWETDHNRKTGVNAFKRIARKHGYVVTHRDDIRSVNPPRIFSARLPSNH